MQVWAATGGTIYSAPEQQGILDDLASITPMGRMVEQTEAQRIELSSALARLSSEQRRLKRKRSEIELVRESAKVPGSESWASGSLTEAVTRRIFDLWVQLLVEIATGH